MPVTYEPISSQTLTSSQSSVTFNSFSGYTDLVFVVQALGTSQANLLMRVGNGSLDTGANYSATQMGGNGSTATSTRNVNDSYYYYTLNSYVQSSTWNTSIHHFMNYSNTATYKTILTRSNNSAVGLDAGVGMWRNTAAITTFQIYPNVGQFATGSTFTLYGIKAA